MSSFKLTGSNGDEVCAQLKANFDAREAQFNAALQAALNTGPSVTPAPAAKPAAPQAHDSAGWTANGNGARLSSRKDDSLRGGMRSSLRPNSSR